MGDELDLAARSIDDDAFFEWLLSDHPWAAEERQRRREQHRLARQALRRRVRELADDWSPAASDELFGLREAAGRFADRWAIACDAWSADGLDVEAVRQRLALVQRGHGHRGYRYPKRYLGDAAAHHLPPPPPLDSATTYDEVTWTTFNRIGQLADGDFLYERFGVERARVTPRVQIRPGNRLVAIAGTEAGPVAWQARWGVRIDDGDAPGALVATIHAETVLSDASTRAAVGARRAIVPVAFVYGFMGDDGGGAPVAITRADRDVLSIAAVGDTGGSVALLTVPSDSAMRAVEARMPLVLDIDEEERWLDLRLDGDDLAAILDRRRSSRELQIRR